MSITTNDTSSATRTQSTSNTSISTPVEKNSGADLQNQFLTLLVAQLKNQDPTNPMSNDQLVSQLAQLNTVSGIEKLNTTLGSISGQINNNQSMQATTLIGHSVMIPGKDILVGKETSTPFGVELEKAAEVVTVTVNDATGKAVRTIELGTLSAGVHSFNWDSKLSDGTVAPDGAYTFTVAASTGGAQQVVQPLSYAVVNSVIRADGGALLDLGLRGRATMDDVRQIL
ncbi:flagellar hook assembly protein FlgD [Pectobacterium parvum]|uniref:Basal-body rod modification protein FlgD n=2 Tax=Pectobacterium TaxID=122277 RepID=A0AAP9IIC3_9GAMM|nr:MULTISPECIES: flagellar hook assembly protein FlgD [Pectobacterium]GKW33046.1 basal-body rod modification protein FlgD [Pectobacterium carotovorum subsp. carotovorum]AZK63357.1 flagellar hook assembly protein FlgD [Pectobacterium versatile]KFX12575.1 flagellar basal body rod modification protein [Pectobacterium parvum]MBN3194046.1 flagellar hook assembly protein FlgD [Pectobacterium versatile]MBQ4775551.1 flagellar hook assembly protein FlgD [Pectobacterium versatile]